MCVTVGTGLAIAGMAAGAATQAYGAHKVGSAAKDAANIQAAGAAKALAAQKQVYDDQRKATQPYMDMGYAALDALYARKGMFPGPQRSPQAAPMPYGGTPAGPQAVPRTFGAMPVPAQMGNGGQSPRQVVQAQAAPPPTFGGMPGPQGPPPGGPPPQGPPPLVRMQAPDGSVSMVPQEMAQRALALGAKQV